jgi:hypothetical protein
MSIFANNLRLLEIEQGHRLIDKAEWLNKNEWNEIIASEDQQGRIRLVVLNARIPGNGAFTRLIAGIQSAGLVPVIVEPIGILAQWCKKHGWRKRIVGRNTSNAHEIWYARP